MKKMLLCCCLLPIIAIAQSNTDSLFIKNISDEILANGKAYHWLYQLTKQVGGRLAGSPQFAHAERWGKATMDSMGADKVWLQACTVQPWFRGKGDKVSITAINNSPKIIPLDALALGNSYGTAAAKGVTAQVVAIKDFDDLEQKKNTLKGKIVFYNYHFNPTLVSTFAAYSDAGKYRWSGASRAAKYGAVGMIVRSMSESQDNNPHTGWMGYNDSFPKIPAAAIGLQDADKLWSLCEHSTVTINLLTHGKFLKDTIAHNVIAELKGKDFPNEIITLGGHLDSWDVNEGAHDDGAGVVHTLEVLRVYKALGYQPKHTIRFVLFANEENGGAGGKVYSETAKANNETHIFALESDEGGFTPRGFSLDVPEKAWLKLNDWKKLLNPYGGDHLQKGGGGADIEGLNDLLHTPVGELVPDNQRYFDFHHARNDVFENVNKRELLLGAVNIAALIYLIDQHGL